MERSCKNWIHDHIKFSLRFDSPWLDTTLFGTNELFENVIWNARPIVPKGDAHYIYNNTVLITIRSISQSFQIKIMVDIICKLEHRIMPQISLVGVERTNPHPRESDN